MKHFSNFFSFILIVLFSGVFLSFYSDKVPKDKFPYKQAGLTERQAAAHLLNRFTYGPKPGDIDEVLKTGLEKWFNGQLGGSLSDDSLNHLLSSYDVLKLSNEEIAKIYPQNGQVLKRAIKEGIINQDSIAVAGKQAYRSVIAKYMREKGYRPQQELYRQLINQKILRAAYSNNQLQEVLTDFWFNHFNVSLTKNQCAEFVLSYERDVIRPNVFNKFGDLLLASAKSPAMLFYLDNFSSSGGEQNKNINPVYKKRIEDRMKSGDSAMVKTILERATKGNQGLNENYAREVMELHTLGVDGGYTQQDVTQAARVLTGWTVFPLGEKANGSALIKQLEKIDKETLEKRGFIRDGDFVFVPNRHDSKEKVVLGKKFTTGGGYKEGVDLLNLLAHHPSTAKFISRKLAIRFVNDEPAQSLIDKMAKTFTERDGDIRAVLLTMVSSPEFWDKTALREKTKSPFELAISTVRSLNAEIYRPFELFTWISRMGQKFYYYQAPTGFPDRGDYWINTGSLLNRMNFGLAVASQRIPGVRINLMALTNNHEPESSEAALIKYSKILMPERDLSQTIKRLTPLLNDPNLEKKIANAADKSGPVSMQKTGMSNEDAEMLENVNGVDVPANAKRKDINSRQSAGNSTMLAQVVGVIIGSPEYQRK